jgi:serine/threonine protein kinase
MPLPPEWQIPAGGKTFESGQAWVHEVVRKTDPGGMRFALKILKNTRRKHRFDREIETMRALSAAGQPVPRVVETGETGGRPYFLMPWFSCGSLQDDVDRKAFCDRPSDGIGVLIQVAEALEQLHAAGYAHRDLKPANLLKGSGDQIYLADFGLVLHQTETDRVTATQEGIGSRFYIAPENEYGYNDSVDQTPADFYAFGKSLYALLAGVPPPPRMDQLAAGRRVEEVTGNASLGRLSGLQLQLLDHDPRTRLADWRSVVEELRLGEEGRFSKPLAQGSTLERLRAASLRSRASASALESDRIRRAADDLKQSLGEIAGALHRGLYRVQETVTSIENESEPAAGVHLSVGGTPLAELLAMPGSEAIRLLVPEGVQVVGEHPHSPALFSIQVPREGSATFLGTYLAKTETSHRLLRIPYVLLVQGLVARPFTTQGLVQRYGCASLPLRPGLQSAVEAAERWGYETGELGLELWVEFLERFSTGQHLDPEWD